MSAHETHATADPAATAGAAAYPRRWLAAVVMIGAALMDMIDITVVNVALPTIRSDLGASDPGFGCFTAWSGGYEDKAV